MNDAETPDDGPREQNYEKQWQDLDERVLLAQIVTELQQIRLLLSQGETGAQTDDDTEAMYECQRCAGEQRVAESDRERHARTQHKAPPEMVDSLFVEVDG